MNTKKEEKTRAPEFHYTYERFRAEAVSSLCDCTSPEKGLITELSSLNFTESVP